MIPIEFKTDDKIKFTSQINGAIWEILECINSPEFNNTSFEDKFSGNVRPKYSCKGIDDSGKEIINNISESLIEKAN